MPPIHKHYDDLMKGKIDRRDFFRKAAAAGVMTPVIANYLRSDAAAAHVRASHNRFSLTRAAAQGSPVGPPAADVDTSDQLVFRGWNFMPEVVQDNTNKFNEKYNENADYQTITGDYIAIMENFHIANQPLDMGYANPATLYRWSIPGWVVPYDDAWYAEAAKAEMYDGVRDSMTVDGKLYGLPYFVSIRGTIMANNAILEKAGITPDQYPKTWDELYDQARQMKKDGVTDGPPLLPHWFAAGVWFGVSWGYLFECLNRGAVLFDDDNQPVFDDATLEVLVNWRKLAEEEIIPEGVFTMGEADYIDAFAKGTYAYSPQQIYDLKVFNDPNKSQIAGMVAPVPVDGQPWGLIDEGIYSLANRNQSGDRLARDYRLGGFFGYRDDVEGGELYVAKRWAIEAALNSGYKAILEDPEVIEAYNSWLPDPAMLGTIDSVVNAGQFPRAWQTFWWEEWNAQAMTELPKAILGQTPVEEVHAGLKTLAEDLASRYQR
jgi:ABC-type glycerol-3-phosphate transport system substrate-binding protein